MTKLVEVLPLSTRVNLTSAKLWVNNIRQWNPLVSVSTLATGWLTSLPSTGLQIPTYWSSAMNSPIYSENNINSSGELVLPGDFNIAINKPFNAEPATFFDILDSFNLVNKVDKPTHRLSNTLNLIIHDADSDIVPRTKVDRLSSYHNFELFDITTPILPLHQKFRHTESIRRSIPMPS